MKIRSYKYWLYKIENIKNHKKYVGITTNINPKKRWLRHISDAYNVNNQRFKCLLSRAIRKYGSNQFYFIILNEYSSFEELIQAEVEFIAKFNSNNTKYGYNLTNGGEGSTGYVITDEHRQKLIDNMQHRVSSGNYVSPNKGNFKLTEQQMLNICDQYKSGFYTKKQLMQLYNCSLKSINRALKTFEVSNIKGNISIDGLKTKKAKIGKQKLKMTQEQAIEAYIKYKSKEWSVVYIATKYGYSHTNQIYEYFSRMKKRHIII